MQPNWIAETADFALVRIGSLSSSEELPVSSCGNTPETKSHRSNILFSVAPTGVKRSLVDYSD